MTFCYVLVSTNFKNLFIKFLFNFNTFKSNLEKFIYFFYLFLVLNESEAFWLVENISATIYPFFHAFVSVSCIWDNFYRSTLQTMILLFFLNILFFCKFLILFNLFNALVHLNCYNKILQIL